jgi:hypothetical protein
VPLNVASLIFDFNTAQELEQHLPLVAGTVMGAAPEVNAETGTVTALVFVYGYLAVDKWRNLESGPSRTLRTS